MLLALALVVSGAIAAIGSTLAASPITWTATVPDGFPTSTALQVDVAGLKDTKQGELAVTSGGASGWASSDLRVARVNASKTSGNNAFYTAVSPGGFVAYRSTRVGGLGSTMAVVYDSRMPYEYSISKNHSIIKSEGKTDTVPITMKDMNGVTITDAVTWTSDTTSVATVNATTGEITAVAESGVANIIGKFTDCYGQEIKIHYSVIVGILNANDVIGPDGDGNFWKPVGVPPNVWQQVEEDGTPIEPDNYVYDKNTPLEGDDHIPVIKGENGNFYNEGPTNIWTPVKPDGNLGENDKIWGGNDFTPGTSDDEDVVNFGTAQSPDYWVNFGENVYAKVSAVNGRIGVLTGAGVIGDPSITVVRPIFDNRNIDGHFYYGPHTDTDGLTYYIGDDWQTGGNGNGLLDTEEAVNPHSTDEKYYRNDDGTMTKERPITTVDAMDIAMSTSGREVVVGEKLSAPAATVIPGNATNQTIEWSSADDGIATVDPATGEVTGVAEGKVMITAAITNPDNTKVTKSYELTVKTNVDASTGDWSDVTWIPGSEFTAGGWDWVIINVDGNGNALVTTKDSVGTTGFHTSSTDYTTSTLKIRMNQFYSDLVVADTQLVNAGNVMEKKITGVAQASDHLSQPGALNNMTSGFSRVVSVGGEKSCFALSWSEAKTYLEGKPYQFIRGTVGKTASGFGTNFSDNNGGLQRYWFRSADVSFGGSNGSMVGGGAYAGYLDDDDVYVLFSSISARPALWIKMQ